MIGAHNEWLVTSPKGKMLENQKKSVPASSGEDCELHCSDLGLLFSIKIRRSSFSGRRPGNHLWYFKVKKESETGLF